MYCLIESLKKQNKLPLCIMDIILRNVYSLQLCDVKNELFRKYKFNNPQKSWIKIICKEKIIRRIY